MRSPGACFEGDGGVTVLCTVFLVSRTFFSKRLCVSHYMAGYLLDRPRIGKALGAQATARCATSVNRQFCRVAPWAHVDAPLRAALISTEAGGAWAPEPVPKPWLTLTTCFRLFSHCFPCMCCSANGVELLSY